MTSSEDSGSRSSGRDSARGGGAGAERASRALRERRRQRDDAAERRALFAVLAMFLSFGGLGFLALNFGGRYGGGSGRGDSSEGGAGASARTQSPPKRSQTARGSSKGASGASATPTVVERRDRSGRRASDGLDETPELPALERLAAAGLTLGAEGIPKVEAEIEGHAARAGIETCRFAYGVWELSPNQTFRFLATCPGLGRLELIGAYEVRGAEVHFSELVSGDVRWTSVLEVERPSTMRTSVRSGPDDVGFAVTQRATVVRGGLHGDAIRDTFRRRNRLALPALPEDLEPSESEAQGRSKLEELLGGRR